MRVMRSYPHMQKLVEAVRELDRAHAEGQTGDGRAATLKVELAAVDLVSSTEMHKRLETIRANLIVEEHFGRLKREARETP
jgi:hypothetical protein